MSNLNKKSIAITTTIVISLISLTLALVSRSAKESITILSHDVEWLLFLTIALLIPLYRNQIFNEIHFKVDIEKIQSELNEIRNLSSSGSVKFIGNANDAAPKVLEAIKLANKVYNTYIIQDNPYTQKNYNTVSETIINYLKKGNGTWEETVSQLGLQRVIEIEKTFKGILPDIFKVRVIRQEIKTFPVCNFIIIKFPKSTGRKDEIFFGWGYFKGDSNGSVFWSDDDNIISFFLGYNRELRDQDISVPYSSNTKSLSANRTD